MTDFYIWNIETLAVKSLVNVTDVIFCRYVFILFIIKEFLKIHLFWLRMKNFFQVDYLPDEVGGKKKQTHMHSYLSRLDT